MSHTRIVPSLDADTMFLTLPVMRERWGVSSSSSGSSGSFSRNTLEMGPVWPTKTLMTAPCTTSHRKRLQSSAAESMPVPCRVISQHVIAPLCPVHIRRHVPISSPHGIRQSHSRISLSSEAVAITPSAEIDILRTDRAWAEREKSCSQVSTWNTFVCLSTDPAQRKGPKGRKPRQSTAPSNAAIRFRSMPVSPCHTQIVLSYDPEAIQTPSGCTATHVARKRCPLSSIANFSFSKSTTYTTASSQHTMTWVSLWLKVHSCSHCSFTGHSSNLCSSVIEVAEPARSMLSCWLRGEFDTYSILYTWTARSHPHEQRRDPSFEKSSPVTSAVCADHDWSTT
mmetsp:Transcript_4520/g.10351  ORF Transcript_4520/g.10351 Transcript_4520/m.10351 type:complete len:339 (+) Transcript_4520:177-1193(+)